MLLLLLSVFSFLSDPITNAYSRFTEHQADVYGLEVTHGILPDAAQAAADSFQVEGESSLAEPDPNPAKCVFSSTIIRPFPIACSSCCTMIRGRMASSRNS